MKDRRQASEDPPPRPDRELSFVIASDESGGGGVSIEQNFDIKFRPT